MINIIIFLTYSFKTFSSFASRLCTVSQRALRGDIITFLLLPGELNPIWKIHFANISKIYCRELQIVKPGYLIYPFILYSFSLNQNKSLKNRELGVDCLSSLNFFFPFMVWRYIWQKKTVEYNCKYSSSLCPDFANGVKTKHILGRFDPSFER